MVSFVCRLLHVVGPAPVTSSLPESLILDSQFGWCSFSLDLHRWSYACGHFASNCFLDIDSRTREYQRRLLRSVLVLPKVDLANSLSSSWAPRAAVLLSGI